MGIVLAVLGVVGWLTMLIVLWTMARASALRERAAAEALDRLRRAGL